MGGALASQKLSCSKDVGYGDGCVDIPGVIRLGMRSFREVRGGLRGRQDERSEIEMVWACTEEECRRSY